MLPTKSSISIEYILGLVRAAIIVCDQVELSLKTCFEGSTVIIIAAAEVRNACAILKEMFRQSVSRRMLKQWLVLIKEYAGKVSISIYEGSSVLGALERALANSKLIR